MEGSLSARDKTLQKSLKFSHCRKSIRKQIPPSCRKNLSTSFCVCLVSWKQRNLEIRVNIAKSRRRPVVSLLFATKSAFTAPNLCRVCALASPVTVLTGDHVMQIWPDLAFGFVHKRSGNDIIYMVRIIKSAYKPSGRSGRSLSQFL